jgi:hypothetical protein
MINRYLIAGVAFLLIGFCYLQTSAATKKTVTTAPATQKADDSKFTLKDVPEKARLTLKQEAKGEKLDNVKKKTVNGKTVYQAKATIDKLVYTFQVDDEGKLISKKSAEPKTADEKAAKKTAKVAKAAK